MINHMMKIRKCNHNIDLYPKLFLHFTHIVLKEVL